MIPYEPNELLEICQVLRKMLYTENQMAQRIIDIDILYYDDLIFKNKYKIPHPKYRIGDLIYCYWFSDPFNSPSIEQNPKELLKIVMII